MTQNEQGAKSLKKELLRIMAAKEEDMPRILEIDREAIAPPWTHGAFLSEVYNDDSFFAVAVLEGSQIASNKSQTENPSEEQPPHQPPPSIHGFAILRRIGDEGELLRIAVGKASRRCGIADSLMDAALGYAKQSALKSVFLEVRKSNEVAIALYKKHGFKSISSRKDYYSDPTEDALVMICPVEQNILL
jgi:ribosomal-protein-alanine N-acetyltransferase